MHIYFLQRWYIYFFAKGGLSIQSLNSLLALFYIANHVNIMHWHFPTPTLPLFIHIQFAGWLHPLFILFFIQWSVVIVTLLGYRRTWTAYHCRSIKAAFKEKQSMPSTVQTDPVVSITGVKTQNLLCLQVPRLIRFLDEVLCDWRP